jgi:4-hydroxy-tetrahydrodipicolinate reductase
MKFIIHGISGKMGQVLVSNIQKQGNEIACGIDKNTTTNPALNFECFATPEAVLKKNNNKIADAIIDFSHYSAVPSIINYAVSTKTPIVVATTALEEKEKEIMAKAAKTTPVFNSFNMSLGINIMAKLAKSAMPTLEPSFNVEILEMHHNQKKDSPSGTALLLADAINDGCNVKKDLVYGRHGKSDDVKLSDLGIHAIRGGSVPGTHSIIFAGQDEIIEIKHTVYSREVFALGAIRAAEFIAGCSPGLYSMDDLV